MSVKILVGDMAERLKEIPDNSVDSCACDPPYHLSSITKRLGSPDAKPIQFGTDGAYARAAKGFMGQQWDGGDVAFRPETWAEILRVLKPGAHLVAFSGTRTYHRMAVAIEDAGFEIRDMIAWHYGSGFPKSLDISKALDKGAGAEREDLGPNPTKIGRTRDMRGGNFMRNGEADMASVCRVTAPATDNAKQWQGFGTALKPATEPICLARKPISESSIAANVLRWGTGALNIDGCRIDAQGRPAREVAAFREDVTYGGNALEGRVDGSLQSSRAIGTTDQGRWPANLVHDGSEEIVAGFPAEAGAAAPVRRRNADKFQNTYGSFAGNIDEAASTFQGDSGSAARFFYCAKASQAERGEGNDHPTVKPIDLMCWLSRLITPKGGILIDPFMGSGSTALACLREQLSFIGCELSPDYVAIADRRIREAAGLFAQIEISEARGEAA